MNKFIGIGRLTKDIELRCTTSGKSVVSNTIAIKNDFKNVNGEYDSEFINIQVWGKTAEFLSQYAKKGSLICIEGRIATRDYDDSNGNKRYVTEVICNSVEFLEKKNSQSNDEDINIYDEDDDSVLIDDDFLD